MCYRNQEQKIKHMEDDIDIYEDLPAFGTETDENFTNNKESIIGEQLELKKQIEELTEKIANFKKINESLEKNLFSLLKTAKAEISRKDRMIDELKKKLDDITFKRHMYHKNGNNTVHKSTLQETTVNAHHKSTNGYFSPNQNTIEADVNDSYYSQVKDESNNKYSLIPLTIFGERVAKRIADEQNLENKDNVKKFNNKNDNNNENTEGYIIESDKENGSLADTNIPNSTEIQSPVITIYKEDKCAKSSLGASKLDTVNDIRPNNNEMCSKTEEKSMPNTNYIGKRARTNDETNRHDSRKRIKLIEEDSITETIKTEVNTNIESTMHINERLYSLSNSDTRHSWTSIRRPVEDYKNEERRDSKHKSSSLRDDRDTAKKYRDFDVPKRDDYRYNHNEYYKIKSRERDRAENYHWSRTRAVSYTNVYREERYGRIQHTKYTSHEDKFQKRYNFHSNNMDKSKNFKDEKDSSNTRNVPKCCNFERNSMDQKVTEIKRHDRYNDYESQKARSRSIERPHKQKAKNTRDSIECLKHSESTNRTIEKDELNIERIAPIVKTEDAQIKNELQNYAETKLEHTPVELEDGQIFDSPENSPYKKEQNGNKVSNNEESVHRELDNHLFSNVNNSTSVKATDNSLPIPNIEYVYSSRSTEITENISNNGSIENVENIEKFIHNCASPRDEAGKKETVTSGIICALEGTTRNDLEINITNITVDNCDREINSEVCTTSISKTEPIVSLVQNHHELVKELPDEKCENTLITVSKENLIKDDSLSQVTNINIAQESCADIISTIESLKKTDNGKTDESYVDNTINDTRSDIKNVGSTLPMRTENMNSSIVTEARVQEEQEEGLKQSNNLSGNRNNDKNVKIKAVNASGKIIVLLRRRKPVCLTDTSANMTVHVNNELECGSNHK
ncbi:uncharacterized protein DDB_G0287625 isoform X2 [Ceratina calcarata]|uniref:Uncharacterized protein DDB_G0287625 isoform X2 n=1 Tax=Ceratina calcarata TaxID=156304 RepID=A0AAJ7NBD7_9HYME|nr:uncharacterized protein DDB_G0287625 isoform X2 [Ceratina calcarata]